MKTHNLMHELAQTAGVFGRNKEVTLAFEGDGAYTTGKEIVLPAIAHGAELNHEAVMVMRGYLDHEAGHIRHTDFEAMRAFGDTNTQQCFQIWNCLEDMWLEKKVVAEYPGAEKNLRVLTEVVGQKEWESIQAHPELYQNVTAEAVQNAILRAGRLDYGGEITKTIYDAQPDKFKEWGQKWVEEVHKCTNSKQLMNLAREIEKLLLNSQKPPEDKKPEDKDFEGDPSDFEFDKDADITGGKPAKSKDGKGKEEGKGESEYTDTLSDLISDYIKGEADKYFKEKVVPKRQQYKVLTTRYDEVYTRNSSNKRKNRRQELMQAGSPADYESQKVKLGGLVNTMKAKLRRALMAKEQRDWDFGREFGRLDTKRLVAGTLGAPAIYKQRTDRFENDTAVHLLVDLSGSMSNRKVQVANDSVIAFAECLEGTQIRYQISGFDNGGECDKHFYELYSKAERGGGHYNRTEPLNLYKFKTFQEPLQVAKGAVSAIRNCAGGNNSDRDAVLWAMEELKSQPQRRKVLMVLSDGQPANDTIRAEHGSLQWGLKNAIDECIKSGVECVGIGILTEHVSELYPKSVSIEKVEDLSGAIFTQLSNLLTGGKVKL